MKKNFSKLYKISSIIFLIFLFIFFSIKSYVNKVSSDISSSIFRLHVIANSDSEEDQNLKYKVRDSIIKYIKELSPNNNSKDETINLAKSHSNELKAIAEQTIIENGFNYDVNIDIGNFDFPSKSYGSISFPAGKYDALQIKIGDYSGKNWWCVMFPPLCFVDITTAEVPEDSKEELEKDLSEEDFKLITQSEATSKFKFKIVELFNKKIAQQQ